ncbi:MAG: phosphotransferase, partial [Litoreibacter sp.]|nr:phosphotransferase [Litoreibacter sp.]
MTDLAAKALEAGKAWGGFATQPRLIAERENAVFDVTLHDGRRAALRLHRPGYQSGASIWSELAWIAELAKRGFPCPTPIETEFEASLVSFGSGHKASLVTWIDATPLADLDDATCMAQMENLGALIRQMHDATDQIETAHFKRPNWDAEALLGADPHWGRFWEHPSLDATEVKTLLAARDEAARQLAGLASLETGLIHADLLRENIL